MTASKESGRPATDSLDELVEFFETHDMGEYWDQMPKADFEIGIVKHKHLVPWTRISPARLPRLRALGMFLRNP